MTTTDSDGWRRRLESRPLLADHPIALRITLALWVLGGALFIALAVPVLEAFVQGVDVVVHQLAVDLEFSPAVRMAVGLDFLGGTWVTVPVMILVGAYLAWRRRRGNFQVAPSVWFGVRRGVQWNAPGQV